MSRKERRSVSLGRHRDRGVHGNSLSNRDSQTLEEELSTRHTISNFLLTLQRVQTAEEENRHLRRENQMLRQRARGSRLSTSSSQRDSPYQHNTSSSDDASLHPALDFEAAEAETKRNSLIFVGDPCPQGPPSSPEHAALEVQYKRLQEDFSTVKDFVQQLFQHAVTLPPAQIPNSHTLSKEEVWEKKTSNINGYCHQKQMEQNLDDIQDQIYLVRNNQDRQNVDLSQVQQALDNVLSQSSVRNDVTSRLTRQQDKVKELNHHVTHLEGSLMEAMTSLRVAEERLCQTAEVSQSLSQYIASCRQLKAGVKDDLARLASRLSSFSQGCSNCGGKTSSVTCFLSHLSAQAQRCGTLSGGTHRRGAEGGVTAEVIEVMTRLERLVGSDWHRLGRMLGLTTADLEEVGKFTNFDLTSRVEKVIMCWLKVMRGSGAEGLKSALEKMDRDMNLLTEPPVTKDWFQPPSEVMTFATAHMVNALDLTDYLAGQGVISQGSKAFIAAVTQEHRRANRLLQTVVYMGLQALGLLCSTLEKHSQNIVAAKIRGSLPSREATDTSIRGSPYQNISPRKSSPLTVYNGSSTLNHPVHTTSGHGTIGHNNNNHKPAATSTPKTSKSSDKPRKKRSRSLFTRKNKQRDVEADLDSGFDVSGDFYYPAVNMNYHSRQSSSASGDSAGRHDDTLTLGRQHARHSAHAQSKYPIANCIDGVVV